MGEGTLERLKQEKFIAIGRNIPAKELVNIADALYNGNIRFFEITFPQHLPNNIKLTFEAITFLSNEMKGKLVMGAGTVLSIEQVQAAYDAGAKFIVSPNSNADVIKETKRLNMVSIPGAMTPSEICFAWDCGADLVKLFPADDLGYHFIENITAPLSHIPLCATGGVNPETIPNFFAAGVKCVAAGVSIIKKDLIQTGNFKEITQLAQLHIDAIRSNSFNK